MRLVKLVQRATFLLLISTLLLPLAAHNSTATGKVGAIGITVSDLDASLPFYTDLLDFKLIEMLNVADETFARVHGVEGARLRIARLELGKEKIELLEYVRPVSGRPLPADSAANDLWFQHIAIVVSDMDLAYQRLQAAGVDQFSVEPQTIPEWNTPAAGIRAFYFKDPDGNPLELIWYPPDKGKSRWQKHDALFLGIDHTAIAVADTEQSLLLYRDLLGLKIVGSSENYGPEQERLSGVFGARVHITALQAPGGGPGIELLEYIAPDTGRTVPEDLAANDMMHTRIDLIAFDLEEVFNEARRANIAIVSPGPQRMNSSTLGIESALLLRDANGHALRLIAPLLK